MSELKPCPNCNGTNFEWFVQAVNSGEAQDGLIKMNEVAVKAFQGCLDCSETVGFMNEHQLNVTLNTRASGWQPRETAPKDGTDFLACRVDSDGQGEWHVILAYEPRKKDDEYPWASEEGYRKDGFFSHWKPLDFPQHNKRMD